MATPGGSVELSLGLKKVTVVADSTGKWTFLVPLDWGLVFGSSVTVQGKVAGSVGLPDAVTSATWGIDCLAGYAANGQTCTDINECLTNNGGCSANGTCTNTPGSSSCACKLGYSGDGKTCTDIDECLVNNGSCSANGTCTNTPGSNTCACKAGYTGDGKTCTDINECLVNNGGCSANGTCTNTPGTNTCACKAGYTGDGKTCSDIDECAIDNGGCALAADCTNSAGSYACACKAGYSGDGKTCSDIDECVVNNGGCALAADCTNSAGSYTCACKPGYSGNGLICTASDSDGDGLSDGLEVGVTKGIADGTSSGGRPVKGTAAGFVGDSDPTTTTNPNALDSDGGSVSDGLEDANLNGKVDSGERDPNVKADDIPSPAKDIDQDGVADAQDNCVYVPNADQKDADKDGVGDVCDGNDGNEKADAYAAGLAVRGGCTSGPAGQQGQGWLWLAGLALALLAAVRRRHGRKAQALTALPLLVATALVGAAAPAQAASGSFDVEQFEAAPLGSGVLNQFGAATAERWQFSAGLSMHYAHRPMTLVQVLPGETRPVGDVVPGRFRGELLGRLGLTDWLEVGAALPLAMTVGTPDIGIGGRSVGDLQGSGLGDVRLPLGADVSKLLGLRDDEGNGLGLGVRVSAWLPTGDVASLHGEDAARVEPRAVVDFRQGRWLVGANLGWMARERSQVYQVVNDDAFRWGAFGEGPLAGESLNWLATVFGSRQTADQVDPLNATLRTDGDNASPMEALVGLHWRNETGLDATLAGGVGLNSAVGAPVSRVVLQLGYVAPPSEKDRDGDGIFDKSDRCPRIAEDKDGFEDSDGCIDPDNDKDGLLDAKDKCPNEPEDVDGFEDADGCPDPDNDQDKLLDPDDKCPDDPTNKCKAARVGGEIVIYERVEFAVNKAIINKKSYAILDAVLAILLEREDLKGVEVQGHTDSDGDDDKNLRLSQARAEAVVAYLTERGIDASRLSPKGYGETAPIAANDSKANKQLNRRVQFVIKAAGVSEKK